MQIKLVNCLHLVEEWSKFSLCLGSETFIGVQELLFTDVVLVVVVVVIVDFV